MYIKNLLEVKSAREKNTLTKAEQKANESKPNKKLPKSGHEKGGLANSKARLSPLYY